MWPTQYEHIGYVFISIKLIKFIFFVTESPGAKNGNKDNYKKVKNRTLGVRPGSGKATTFSETNYQVPTGMLGNDKFK